MKKIGLIVNPVAGIGGKVGLKGSDGEEIYKEALRRGAVMESGERAAFTLRVLKRVEESVMLFTCPGEMGEDACKAAGLAYTVPDTVRNIAASGGTVRTAEGHTTSADTIHAARAFLEAGAELILFAGGDGTARDIMDAVGTDMPVLGIPAGCKIHSGVYALNPGKAGELAADFALGKVRRTKEAEVMDIDEEQFREEKVQSRLYGYLTIPDAARMVQNRKSGSSYSEQGAIERLSDYIADTWDEDALYIVGGGSTTASIMRKMNLPYTLLGIDLVHGGRLIAADCTEKQILAIMDGCKKVKILVTVIGGQGCLFGRGNQQISAEVLRRAGRENIIVAASPDKMLSFLGESLYVDTGDESMDQYLAGYIKVITGYGEYAMIRVSG